MKAVKIAFLFLLMAVFAAPVYWQVSAQDESRKVFDENEPDLPSGVKIDKERIFPSAQRASRHPARFRYRQTGFAHQIHRRDGKKRERACPKARGAKSPARFALESARSCADSDQRDQPRIADAFRQSPFTRPIRTSSMSARRRADFTEP